MKQVNIFFRFLITPLYAAVSTSCLCFIKPVSIWLVFCVTILDFLALASFLVSIKYSDEYIKSSFLNKDFYLMLNEISCVAKGKFGFYKFFKSDSKFSELQINFWFQSTEKKELFDLIKQKNPSCVFRL